MIVYIIIFAMSMGLANMVKRIPGVRLWIKALISSMPVVLLTGLRYDVGTDFFSYEMGYYGLRHDYDEIIFLKLSDFLANISNYNYQVFIFVTSFLFVYILYLAIWHLSDNVEISILMFMLSTFYFGGMNAIRQGIAVSICLYAIRYIVANDEEKLLELNTKKAKREKRNNILKFIICVVIAMMIHDTTIICLGYLVLDRIKFNNIKPLIAVALAFAFSNKIRDLLFLIIKNTSVKHYGSVINPGSSDVAETYILMVIGTFLVVSYIKWYYETDRTFNLFFNMLLVAMILGIFTTWMPYGKRVMWNYLFVIIFLIPKAVGYLKIKTNRQVMYSLFVVYFFALAYQSIVLSRTHGCIPYQWCL